MVNSSIYLEKLPRTIELIADKEMGTALRYVDQRALPYELKIELSNSWEEIVDAIKMLAIRGAPAIGVSACAALAVWAAHEGLLLPFDRDLGNLTSLSASSVSAQHEKTNDRSYETEFRRVCDTVAHARPTAVNLSWGVEQASKTVCYALEHKKSRKEIAKMLFDLAKELEKNDESVNRAIGSHGALLLPDSSTVLTYCNAGSLATCFFGTALGVIYTAAQKGKIKRVYSCETRPVNQGARLTCWELTRAGVPVTLLCDNMAASLMRQEPIDAIIIGADRIACNGDVANKIGTYGLALLAKAHNIPFYVAAPFSTIDANISDASAIAIETRDSSEILPRQIEGLDIMNPAFDVTPAALISKIITEKGSIEPHMLKSWL